MALTYEPIATTTLGTATTTVTFSSIPNTYTDLRLVCMMQATANTTDGKLRFNNDSSSNYSDIDLQANGTSVFSGSNQTDGIYLNTNTINQVWHFYTCDIFSYAGSTYKTTLGTTSEDDNGTGRTGRIVGLWLSTSAINRIDLVSTTIRTFAVGSKLTLFGIKAA